MSVDEVIKYKANGEVKVIQKTTKSIILSVIFNASKLSFILNVLIF